MIIAEIGMNHRGSEFNALKMLKALVKSKVDGITFQIAYPSYYTKKEPHRTPLSNNFYKKSISIAHQNKKLIGFAIADIDKVSFLNKIGIDFWKTLSFDLLNYPLHNKLQTTKKPVFVSTGLSGEKEIKVICKKYKNLVLVHTQLSHDIQDANLKAIQRLKKITKHNVAFGLHHPDTDILFTATAFEPSDIFFYCKEDLNKKYPDGEHSVRLKEIDLLVEKICAFQKALGTGIKRTMKGKLKHAS